MTRADEAEALAGLGLHVFPVGPDCRRPLTEHGYKDASATPWDVAALWQGRPDANIAIATGNLSGVFVLDVDCKNGGADGRDTLQHLIREHDKLPESWRSETPSGGSHLYFRQPDDRALRNKVNIRPGLDVRTTGGSAAAPPSQRGEGGYAWIRSPFDHDLQDAPSWLLNIIDPPPQPRAPLPKLHLTQAHRTVRYVERALSDECRRVSTMKSGGRNHQLFRSAAAVGELVASGMLTSDIAFVFLYRAAEDCGLLREDGRHSVEETIKSGFRAGARNPREIDLGRRA